MGLEILVVVALLTRCGTAIYNPKYEIKSIGERSELGEGPYWDAVAQRLYWVDMRNNVLCSYEPASGKQPTRVKIDTPITPVTLAMPVTDTSDIFVVGIKGSLALVKWDGISNDPIKPKFFLDIEDPKGDSRLNDGKADPSHRLWAGSMGKQLQQNPNVFEKGKGGLFLVTPAGEAKKREENLEIANGLDWSLEKDKLYFVDSLAFKVYQYDYDDKEGTIRNQKVVFDLKARGLVEAMNSLPDGMTIDTEGMLWVAVYGTQKVIRINPNNGELLLTIEIPECLQPTSVAFGDKDLKALYVTSAKVDWTDDFEQRFPQSGKLFKITGLEVQGLPSRSVTLDQNLWKDL